MPHFSKSISNFHSVKSDAKIILFFFFYENDQNVLGLGIFFGLQSSFLSENFCCNIRIPVCLLLCRVYRQYVFLSNICQKIFRLS